jgi:hypothetical protein
MLLFSTILIDDSTNIATTVNIPIINSKYAAVLKLLPLGITFKYINDGSIKQVMEPPIPPLKLRVKLRPLLSELTDINAKDSSRNIVRSICKVKGISSLFLPIISLQKEYLIMTNLLGRLRTRCIHTIT